MGGSDVALLIECWVGAAFKADNGPASRAGHGDANSGNKMEILCHTVYRRGNMFTYKK